MNLDSFVTVTGLILVVLMTRPEGTICTYNDIMICVLQFAVNGITFYSKKMTYMICVNDAIRHRCHNPLFKVQTSPACITKLFLTKDLASSHLS